LSRALSIRYFTQCRAYFANEESAFFRQFYEGDQEVRRYHNGQGGGSRRSDTEKPYVDVRAQYGCAEKALQQRVYDYESARCR
jgi:hypothetical protein